jgi:hypothetical protein
LRDRNPFARRNRGGPGIDGCNARFEGKSGSRSAPRFFLWTGTFQVSLRASAREQLVIKAIQGDERQRRAPDTLKISYDIPRWVYL